MGKTAKKKRRKPTKIGRSRIKLTAAQLKTIARLASFGCSIEEISQILSGMGVKGASASTLFRRLADDRKVAAIIDAGIATGNVRLRSRMMKQAMMMNGAGVHQAQFLAVNRLGMSRDPDKRKVVDPTHGANLELADARQRVAAQLEAIAKRLFGGADGIQPGGHAEVLPLAIEDRSGSPP